MVVWGCKGGMAERGAWQKGGLSDSTMEDACVARDQPIFLIPSSPERKPQINPCVLQGVARKTTTTKYVLGVC